MDHFTEEVAEDLGNSAKAFGKMDRHSLLLCEGEAMDLTSPMNAYRNRSPLLCEEVTNE